MKQEEKKKFERCPLCEKNCSVNELECPQGVQLFDDSEDLFRLFRRVGHVLYQSQVHTNGQGRAMHIMAARGTMSQRELQEILNIKAGSLSEIIGKLEAKGYLTKIRDTKDQRKMVLKITAKGRKSPEEAAYMKSREDMFKSLDEKDQEQLKKLLKKLLDRWQDIEEKE